MDFLLKGSAYVVYVLFSLYFFFGKDVNKRKTKHTGIIMLVSILVLSYYYWFPHE
ncbi:hypothetical protein [Bacillus sp. AK128]